MSSSSLPADVQPQAEVATAPTPGKLFLTVFPSIMLPMFLAAIDQTIVSTALPAHRRLARRCRAGLLGRRVLPRRHHDRRPGVRPPRRRPRPAAHDVRRADLLRRRVRSVRRCHERPDAYRGARAAGPRRRRPDDACRRRSSAKSSRRASAAATRATSASIFVCSSTFGPVAGGWLTQHFGWQSVFLINSRSALLAIGMALRLPKRAVTGGGRFRFDFIGVALFAGFIAPLLLALEQAQRFDPRTLPLVLVMLRGRGRLARAADPPGAAREHAAAAGCTCCGSRRSGARTRWPRATARRWSR